MPAAKEVFQDALATGRDFRRGGHGGPADRALWLIGEQVGAAPGEERTGLVKNRRESRQECELGGAVLSAAHTARGRVFVHGRTAGLTDPSRDVLTQEVIQFRRESSPRGPFELDPAERTGGRAGPYKRTTLGTKEQMFGGITIRRSSEKSQERVHERGGESLHGRELLAGGGPKFVVCSEARRDPPSALRVGAGDRTQPFEVALVHRRVWVAVLPKAPCNVAITASSHFLNMRASGVPHPGRRIGVERDFQQDPSRTGAESNGEGRFVAAEELRRESIVREPTEERLSERVGPASVRFPLPNEEIRGIRSAVPSVLRDAHEPEAGQLGSNLARGLTGKMHPVREFLERDAG